jgi:hypothetical protein
MSDLSLNEDFKKDLLLLFESKEFKDNIIDINTKPNGFSYKIEKGCRCSNMSICNASCCKNIIKFVTAFTQGILTVFGKYGALPTDNLPKFFVRCDTIKSNFFDTCGNTPDVTLKPIATLFAELIGKDLHYFDLFKKSDNDNDSDSVSDFFNTGGSRSHNKRSSSKKSRKSHRRHRRSTHNKKRHTKQYKKRYTKRYRHRK